jgi:hypothetical protein
VLYWLHGAGPALAALQALGLLAESGQWFAFFLFLRAMAAARRATGTVDSIRALLVLGLVTTAFALLFIPLAVVGGLILGFILRVFGIAPYSDVTTAMAYLLGSIGVLLLLMVYIGSLRVVRDCCQLLRSRKI